MQLRRLVLFTLAGCILTVAVLGVWLFQAPYRDQTPWPTPPQEVKREPSPVDIVPLTSGELPPLESPAVATIRHRTPPLSRTENFLLAGTDKRPDSRWGGLADSLIVAVLETESKHLGLISIPRDLLVDIPKHGPDRINATLHVARRTKQDPLELLQRVVRDTLALPIRHTMVIDLGVFERAVDALGGVTVDVRCPIVDNFIDARAPGGRRLLSVAAGPQLLDGVTAAMYARSRHGRSDWSRARRQQAILFGVRRKLTTIDGLSRLPELWSELESSILTEMRRVEVLNLARRLAGVPLERMHGLVLGHKQTHPHRTEDNRDVLLPDYAAIDAAVGQLFSADHPGHPAAKTECAPEDAALQRRARRASRAGGEPDTSSSAEVTPQRQPAAPATAVRTSHLETK